MITKLKTGLGSLFFALTCYNAIGQNQVSEFCLLPNEVVIRPNASDFSSNNVGKVLISDNENEYFTSAQTTDRVLNIAVEVPEEYKGEMLYFILNDPADPSDYANGTENDNLCEGVEDGFLLRESSRALLYTPYGFTLPIATNQLTITNKCSGDNYEVECSMTPPDPSTGKFPPDAIIYKSIVYKAWKRLDIDYYALS